MMPVAYLRGGVRSLVQMKVTKPMAELCKCVYEQLKELKSWKSNGNAGKILDIYSNKLWKDGVHKKQVKKKNLFWKKITIHGKSIAQTTKFSPDWDTALLTMVGTCKKSWPHPEVFAFKMMKGIHKCWIVGMFYGLFADKPWTKTGMEKIKLIRKKYALLLILADLNKAMDWGFFSKYATDQWQIFLTISMYKYILLCAFLDTNW